MTTDENNYMPENNDGLKAVRGGFKEKTDRWKSRPRKEVLKGT